MRRIPPALLLPAFVAIAPSHAGIAPGPSARGYAYRAWTSANGLPQSVITDMTFGRRGFLALGTSAGLVIFDGRRFTALGVSALPEVRSNYVAAVAADPRGGLWIGTPEGAIHRVQFGKVVDSLRPFPGADITVDRILVRPRGEIWVASDERIRRYLNRQWTEMTLDGAPLSEIKTMRVDRAGTLWVGSAFGLYRFIDGRLREEPLPAWVLAGARLNGPSGIHAIAEDGEGRMWFGTPTDLLVRDPGGRFRRVTPPGALEGIKRNIEFDPSGQLWMGGGWGVLALRVVTEGDELRLVQTYRHDAELGGATVSRLLVDSAGAVVVGTSGRGLRTYAPLPFTRITMADGLPMSSVHHVVGDGPDALWIGTSCRGVSHLDSTGIRVHEAPQLGLGRDQCVRSLARDRDGGLWVGQRGRISHVATDGEVRIWPFDSVPGLRSAFALLPVGEELLFGVRPGGLRRIRADGTMDEPPRAGALSSDPIWSLARDSSGALWVGQVGEVTRLAPDGARVFRVSDGVPPGPIRVLHADAEGSLWIGSYGGGLARLRDGRVRRLTSAQGLFDDALSALLPDGSGRFWLLGNAGVFAVRHGRLDSAMSGLATGLDGVLYGAADGMPEGNGGYPAAWRQPDGRLYFASVDGLAVFEGAATARALSSLEARFVSVETPAGTQVPGDTVTLQAGVRTARFGFSAPSIGAADRLQFRYRVRERDEAWIDAGSDRELALDQLAPGMLTLELAVRDGDGIWTEAPTVLTVLVPPAWWQTWWMRALLVAAITGSVVLLLRLRVRAVEEHNRELRREIAERQRAELRAQQHLTELAHVSRVATAGELASSLAHELNQPLSAIAGNADAARTMLQRGTGTPEELQEVLGDIAQESRRAAGIIRTLRQFLRRGDVETERLDLAATVRETLPLLQHVLHTHRVELLVDDRVVPPPVAGNRVGLQQVVVNLLVNAAEAMDACGAPDRRVLLRLGRSRLGARLTVADTGPGIVPERRRDLFEPFTTTKSGGIGMGLAICRSIVEAHGGTIHARRAPWGGAVFSIELPKMEGPA